MLNGISRYADDDFSRSTCYDLQADFIEVHSMIPLIENTK